MKPVQSDMTPFQIPMTGRWKPAFSGAQLPEGDFQVLTNMRYTETPGIKAILGMSKINATDISFAPPPTPTAFSPISMGGYHTLGIKSNGDLYAWGLQEEGEIGNNQGEDFVTYTNPVQVLGLGGTGFLQNITYCSAGEFTSYAVDQSGVTYCWGFNQYGQLGLGTNSTFEPVPVKMLGPGGTGFMTNVKQIAGGKYFTIVLKTDGTVYATGANSAGRQGALGQGNTTDSNVFLQVKDAAGTGFLSGITYIAAGSQSACAVGPAGIVWGWGFNFAGELGVNDTSQHLLPIQVLGAGGSGFASGITKVYMPIDTIAALASTLMINSSGNIYCAGSNRFGSFGVGNNTATPVLVQTQGVGGVGFASGITALGLEQCNTTLAIGTGSNVFGWGTNTAGDIGLGTSDANTHYTPEAVPLAGTSGLFLTGSYAMILVNTDGTAIGWGENFAGQLGDGSTTERDSPVTAGGGLTFLI